LKLGNAKKPKQPDLNTLLHNLNSATTAANKGQALEVLTGALFGCVTGFSLQDSNVKTETEEIDLVIFNASDDPRLRREQAIILVECKNWTSRCGKSEFVEFKEKMENRKGRCSLGFLVSWNGFADTVTKEMLRGSREHLLVVPIDGARIRSVLGEGSSIEQMILSAWDNAIAI
jgi:hypothetical protein